MAANEAKDFEPVLETLELVDAVVDALNKTLIVVLVVVKMMEETLNVELFMYVLCMYDVLFI